MDKRGMSMRVLIASILILLFLITGIFMFRPLFSSEVQYGMKEQVCRISLVASKFSDIGLGKIVPNVCSAERIKFNDKIAENKEEAMQYILEKMRRCSKIYDIPSRGGATKHKDCYVCYSLESDKKNLPFEGTISAKEFQEYAIEKESPRGKTYARELQEGNREFLFLFKNEEFDIANKDYAIIFADDVKAGDWAYLYSAAGLPFILFIGGPVGWVLGGVAAVGGALYAELQISEVETDVVMLTELNLKEAQKTCSIITS